MGHAPMDDDFARACISYHRHLRGPLTHGFPRHVASLFRHRIPIQLTVHLDGDRVIPDPSCSRRSGYRPCHAIRGQSAVDDAAGVVVL